MKIQIDGVGTVEVGDDFVKMQPEQQNAFIAHITEQAQGGAKSGMPGAKLDKYQQAAQEDLARQEQAGFGGGYGLNNSILNGQTLGAAPTILSALNTPVEMIKHGTFDPTEGYAYAKARQDMRRDKYRDEHPILDAVGNAAGGIATGAGIANAGGTLVKAGQGLGARTAAMAGEGAAYGGVTGFNEGDGLEGRLTGAAKGGLLGGAIGGALPGLWALGKAALAPAISNYQAWKDPAAAAQARVLRALSESGQAPDQVAQKVSDAAASGQGVYTLADALGNPGQNLASTVARAPGEGRTAITEFLENRQAGQGRRIAGALAEGFDAPQTAQQTEAAMRANRSATANQNYGAARDSAGSVNVTPAIDLIDQQVRPGVQGLLSPGTEVGSDTVSGLLTRARSMLTNGKQQLSDFGEVLQVKKDLDAIIERASPTQQRSLIPVRDALDDQLAATSQPYANARDVFRQQSQAIDAIPQGKSAAMRGRMEDTIPAFQRMPTDQQAAFRVGYVDPLIESTQAAPPGVNKARPFMSDAHQAEFNAFAAPGRAQTMQERLAREMEMFETRRIATGGSRTADNLANEEAAGIDPRIWWNALRGDFGKAAANAIHASGNALTGNTPAVRSELASLLLRSGDNADIAPMLENLRRGLLAKQERGAKFSRGLLAGSGEYLGQRK